MSQIIDQQHLDLTRQWLEVALALRVFGPDVFRLLHRLLALAVQAGIAGIVGGGRHSSAPPPSRRSAAPPPPPCRHGDDHD
ncbi:hypothetical protein I5Q34_05725 [Streptomyces sp. AV19]|uniref:hypothetical protein n=1 Tax=Streptomyces sp. AV19 TaxID=2793068 RepID=UPI0018FE4670|nr:hypothetical protein [Streptomyces sp. AV19]MBH1933800.1 hypothetical protein [Streptomyces sp. AV19]MDG4535695.1 hypothetical protein [Streptomyces sp. AV19]